MATIVVLPPALIALATGQPWLVPSLGPTIFLQVLSPDHKSAQPYPALAGHAIGAIVAIVAVFALGAAGEASPMSGSALSGARAAASVIALPVTMVVQLLLRATHPPAAATTLLITLGGLKPNVVEIGALAGSVILVVIIGEAARRLRIG